MSRLTGAGTLLRFALRRERLRIRLLAARERHEHGEREAQVPAKSKHVLFVASALGCVHEGRQELRRIVLSHQRLTDERGVGA